MTPAPWASLYQRRDSGTIRIRHVELPRRAHTRVVLASDLHARDDWFPPSCVSGVVRRINDIDDVDAVLLPGDFVGDHELEAIDWAAPLLAQIEPPTFATLGNHDHWLDGPYIERTLEEHGIRVLTNESQRLDGWHLAGIDSCWGGRPDVATALAAVPRDEPAVVMGHEPHLATMHDRFLHVAGHTHHGQVRPPLVAGIATPRYYPRYSQPYPRGLYARDDGTYVYTTAGVGYSVVSWRLNCPPEIVVIDL